jgi:small subunit ribosomal protein S1
MSSTNNPSSPSASDLSAEMNAEINAAMEQLDAESVAAEKVRAANAAKPAAKPAIRGPRVVSAGREHRTGNVVSVGPTDIFIEFGPKELGVISRTQYPDDALPVVGTAIEVVVDKFEAAESLFVCSRPGAVQKAAWEFLEPGQVVEARVTGVTKGGLELEVANHRAFMPASQVSIERVPDLAVFVGEKMKCAITRVERSGRGNIVLSRRDVLDIERKANAETLKTKLAEGDTVEGTVRKIMPFGAFVDLGGVDGLIHISDLTFDRIGFGEKAVEKFVKEGEKVTVKIIKLDWEGGRISLGLKQVAGDPFANATASIVEGAELTGRVTKTTEFGAFVELSRGVEGLVHISELDYKRVEKVDDVVKADQVVQVKVLKIDPASRRISLSIKALKAPPEMPAGGGGPGGGGGQGGGGGYGGGGKFGGKGKKGEQGRSAEEILKETPALRRMREKFKKTNFKGGLS